MMPGFSQKSLDHLFTCDKRLVDICTDVNGDGGFDITIICGHRNKEEQNNAFAEGKSKLKWPESKHNKNPSLAVDIAPYPIDWNDIDKFKELNKRMQIAAGKLKINLQWGGTFTFKDYDHWEIV